MKDLVIVSGFNVCPFEVERVISMLPEVLEAGVIGIPDQEHGEVIKAFVVLKPEMTLSEKEIVRHTHDILAAYKSPRVVRFVESLPKTPVGKILKTALREMD